MLSIVWIMTLCVCLTASGCRETDAAGSAGAKETANTTGAESMSKQPFERLIHEVAASNNAFALDLYRQLRPTSGNLFFSPYSISSALAMTWAGARGETARQMKAALKLALPDDELHQAFGGLTRSLNERGEAGGYELTVANALWAQQGYPFRKEYLELTRTAYEAAFKNLDFATSPEPSRLAINAWVEEKTRDRIKDLLPQGSVNSMTRLVLTNAIYFKGKWADQFDPKQSFEAPFHLTASESTPVFLMHRMDNVDYMEKETFQAVRLPYRNDELSMVVLLPRSVDGLAALEDSLDSGKLVALTEGFRNQKIQLFMPRFKMTSQFNLGEPLAALGMRDAFDPRRADFSGLTEKKDLSITAVLHKAFVEVNEEGTEAAAATGVVMGVTSVRPITIPEFRVDHPFLFVIQDNQSGGILFMGRLTNPAG
jgi:serine protease inhibitor